MINITEYEQIAGYTPAPGERCPSCQTICGPGGPDHATTCALVVKLWAHEQNHGAMIPVRQMELGSNPDFATWAAKMAGSLFRQPRALPIVPRVDPAQVKAPSATAMATEEPPAKVSA